MKHVHPPQKRPRRTTTLRAEQPRQTTARGLALLVAGALVTAAPQAWSVVTESATAEAPATPADPRGMVGGGKSGDSARYVVRFKASPSLIDGSPGAASTRRSERTRLSADLAARGTHGKHVKREFHRVYNGVAIEAAAGDIDFIRSLSYVADIQPDVDVHTALATSVPDIGATAAWTSYGVTGSGVRVAILDTGVDYTHSDLGGCFGPSCKVIGGYDFVNDDADPADDNGHGTHVAGIVAANGALKGVAPDASLLAYKVLGASGSGLSSGIIAALDAAADPDDNPATDDGAHVVNLSLGAPGGNPDDPMSVAVDTAVARGIVVIATAGNDGPFPQTVTSPGTSRRAITVGASYIHSTPSAPGGSINNYRVISFSSRGPVLWPQGAILKPDIVAPGYNICSARWATAWSGRDCLDSQHSKLSGTSMAAPHIAGVAALLRQHQSTWSPDQIKQALRSTAKNLGDEPVAQGYGQVQTLAALALTQAPPIATVQSSGALTGRINVVGTASGDGFSQYQLAIGAGLDPTTWSTFSTSATPVTDGILAPNFDATARPDGSHTLRLRVVDATGLISEDRAFIEIDNVRLSSPASSTSRRFGDTINIVGRVTNATGFQSYTIEYGAGASPESWLSAGITLANGGGQPVIDGVLGTWNSGQAPAAGAYTLRVVANYSWGSAVESVKSIELDANLKPGWPVTLPWDAMGGGWWSPPGKMEPVISDVDGDGTRDIVITRGGNPSKVEAYRHDGSLIWSVALAGGSYGGGAMADPIGVDLENDGRDEIVTTLPIFGSPWTLRLFVINSNGTIRSGFPVSIPYNYSRSISAADLDRDGTKEIVVHGAKSYPAGYERFLTIVNAAGGIVTKWALPVQRAGNGGFAIGNFDDDSETEIVIAEPSEFAGVDGSNNAVNNTGIVTVYNRDGSLVPGWPKYTDGFTDGVTNGSPVVADIDGDLKDDIVVPLSYLRTQAPGTPVGGVAVFNRDGNLLPGWPQLTGRRIDTTPALGDLDGDGRPEIVVQQTFSCTPTCQTWVLRGSGTIATGWPKFGPNQYLSAPSIADVSGDGLADVIVVSHTGDGRGVTAWDASGNLIAGFPLFMGPYAWSPATITDLDNDGRVEIIASTEGDVESENELTTKPSGNLYLWELPATHNPGAAHWPQAGRDNRRTHRYAVTPVADLVESALSTPPSTLNRGSAFTIDDTARNRGTIGAGASETRFYLSTDSVRDAADIRFGASRLVPALAVQAVSTGATTITIPSATPIGNYSVFACADDTRFVVEGNESNNCMTSGMMTVTAPDLQQTQLGAVPGSASRGARFTVQDATQNKGTGSATNSTTQYFLSLDKLKSSNDIRLDGRRTLPALAAAALLTGSATVTVPAGAPLGSYYLLSCADIANNVKFEVNEKNNCRASSTKVTVKP